MRDKVPPPVKGILYSDLDGTFLDPHTYSWSEALPALRAAGSHSVPIVFCSSKTCAEIEIIRNSASVADPFVGENGGGIFVPANYFPFSIEGAVRRGPFEVIALGTPYPVLTEALGRIRDGLRCGIIGFSDMTAQEVADDCGLTLEEAFRAKQRDYDEPFKILDADPATRQLVFRKIQEAGLRWTVGGRYLHLSGDNDKGRAVTLLSELYRRSCRGIYTVGLGDSLNDLPMLKAVDLPVLVKKPDGRHDQEVLERFPRVRLAEGIGPQGWNEAVLRILEELKQIGGVEDR